jgi:ketosteroid isomerase-like protein
MDRQDVARWLDAYVAAWRSNEAAQIEALFTPETTYRFQPYEPPVTGAGAIAAAWLEAPDDPDSWEAAYEPVAVDGDTAVAVGSSHYRETDDAPARTYHNCFVMRFDDQGRCRDFVEWFVRQPD